jgi:MFS family permease
VPRIRSLRHTFRFMRGNMLVFSVTDLLGNFCRRLVFPYASLYILALGGDPPRIGLINALSPFAGLLMFPIGGYLADRGGRVRLIALANYIRGAILLMYVLAPRWEVIAVAALLQGFMVIQFPASSSLIADSLLPRDRGKGIATMNTIAGALAIFAPYIAGTVVDICGANSGMRALYAVMMMASLASGAIHLRFLKETSQRSEERLSLSELPRVFKDAYGGIPTMLRRLPRSLKALAGVIVLTFVANGVASPFWVVYAVEQIGLSSVEWGLILLIQLTLQNLLFIPIGTLVDHHGRTRSLVVALLLSLVSIPLFAFARSFAAVLLTRAAIAIAFVTAVPACSALMADTVPRDVRGRVMAALGQGGIMLGMAGGGTGGPAVGFIVTIPLMIASFAGGYLYALNPSYPWFLTAVTTAISIILVVLFIRDPQRAEV